MNVANTVVDATAALTGIAVEPAWRADVEANLAVLLRFSRDVEDFPLPDEAEPAPIFMAGS